LRGRTGAVEPRTDIYSLGLVLLECLTGEKAFPGPIVESAVARLVRDPEIPAELGTEWVDLLKSMTARTVEARPEAHHAACTLRTLAAESDALQHAVASADYSPDDAVTGGFTTGNIYIPLPPAHAPSL
jgi:serine/threonine protein kinase